MRRALTAALLGCIAMVACVPAAANILHYSSVLSGTAESPPNASPGTGFVSVDVDDVLNTLRVQATFSGLLGATTAAHIHCCTATAGSGTAGVATTTPSFVLFPLGVTSGTFDQTYNLLLASTYNPAFVTASGGTTASAEAALLLGMSFGLTYFNIHTSVIPGGEIRGFLTATAVPEPAGAALLTVGLVAMALRRRSRHRM